MHVAIRQLVRLSLSTCCNPLSSSIPTTSFSVFVFSFHHPLFPGLQFLECNPPHYVAQPLNFLCRLRIIPVRDHFTSTVYLLYLTICLALHLADFHPSPCPHLESLLDVFLPHGPCFRSV